jgi:hypothetical protein
MAELSNSLRGDSLYEEGDSSSGASTCHLGGKDTNQIRKCGPPVLLDDDESGVGFWGNLYCPYCGERCDFILIDFDYRIAGLARPRTEIDMQEWRENFLKCPKCGYAKMELLQE